MPLVRPVRSLLQKWYLVFEASSKIWIYCLPLILLSFLSLAFVFTLNVNPLNSKGWFKGLIGHVDHNFIDMHLIEDGIHHAHDQAMYLSLFFAFLGISISVIFYYLRKVDVDKVTRVFNLFGLYNLSRNKFHIDKVYNAIIYRPFFNQTKIASFIDWDIYDQKIIDAWGWITLKISNFSGKADYSILDQKIIDGVAHLINYTSNKMKKIQSGVIQNYLLGGFMCLVLIIMVIQQFN